MNKKEKLILKAKIMKEILKSNGAVEVLKTLQSNNPEVTNEEIKKYRQKK